LKAKTQITDYGVTYFMTRCNIVRSLKGSIDMAFIGRTQELTRLRKQQEKNIASFVVVPGRLLA
jgi:hypothetical protein